MNLSTILSRNNNVSIHIHDSLGYVIDPEKGKIRVLNPTGVDIWNAINGKNSVQDIIHHLTVIYDQKSTLFQKEVIDFLLQLKERSLIYLKEE
jgi:hypothetical protein